MGKDSVDQKQRFIGINKGTKSRNDVLHLYNFKNIRNNVEKPFLVQAVINGAEQAGYTDDILFLNYVPYNRLVKATKGETNEPK